MSSLRVSSVNRPASSVVASSGPMLPCVKVELSLRSKKSRISAPATGFSCVSTATPRDSRACVIFRTFALPAEGVTLTASSGWYPRALTEIL